MMAEDATPLVEALLAIIDAARAYLPPAVLDRLSASGGGTNSIDQSAVGPLRAVR